MNHLPFHDRLLDDPSAQISLTTILHARLMQEGRDWSMLRKIVRNNPAANLTIDYWLGEEKYATATFDFRGNLSRLEYHAMKKPGAPLIGCGLLGLSRFHGCWEEPR